MANRKWSELFAEFQTWVAQNKRLPRAHAGDLQEKRLGYWRLKQRKLQKKGALQGDRKQLLESIEAVESINTENWAAMLENLKQFYAEHKRNPTRYQSAPAWERKLAGWRLRTLADLKKGLLAPHEARMIVDAGLVPRNYRLPPDMQVSAAPLMTEAVSAPVPSTEPIRPVVVPEAAPAAHPPAAVRAEKPDIWYEQLKRVIQFKKQNDRLPVQPALLPGESPLADWCLENVALNATGELPKQKRSLLQAAGII